MTGRRRSGPEFYRQGTVGLLAAILSGSANLRGARCVEFVGEFDSDRRAEDLGYADETERWQTVTAVCRSCPVRAACWSWSSGLGQSAVSGPTATSEVNPFRMAHRWQRTSTGDDAEAPERTETPGTTTTDCQEATT